MEDKLPIIIKREEEGKLITSENTVEPSSALRIYAGEQYSVSQSAKGLKKGLAHLFLHCVTFIMATPAADDRFLEEVNI